MNEMDIQLQAELLLHFFVNILGRSRFHTCSMVSTRYAIRYVEALTSKNIYGLYGLISTH